MPAEPHLTEQYKILWDTLNKEMDRFWSRYNILIGIQIGIIVFLLRFNSDLKNSPELSTLIYIIPTITSLITCALINQAKRVYSFQWKLILKFEETNRDYVILSIVEQLSGFESIKIGKSYSFANILALVLLAIWSVLLIFSAYSMFK